MLFDARTLAIRLAFHVARRVLAALAVAFAVGAFLVWIR